MWSTIILETFFVVVVILCFFLFCISNWMIFERCVWRFAGTWNASSFALGFCSLSVTVSSSSSSSIVQSNRVCVCVCSFWPQLESKCSDQMCTTRTMIGIVSPQSTHTKAFNFNGGISRIFCFVVVFFVLSPFISTLLFGSVVVWSPIYVP